MEKYGVQEDDLISGLREEEHILMGEMAEYMIGGEKTATEESAFRRHQSRLQNVRDKITEHDLKKFRMNEVKDI